LSLVNQLFWFIAALHRFENSSGVIVLNQFPKFASAVALLSILISIIVPQKYKLSLRLRTITYYFCGKYF